jgi:hypothetical protein
MPELAQESIGTLLIDLRANIAQLQVDMDGVKNVVQKSSKEMSAQMKSDMTETRQVLALMRDDFGVGIPRELRASIASVAFLRDAVLGLQDAFIALAFINIGVEVFKKIEEHFTASAEAAKKEAEETHKIVQEAQNAVDATEKRQLAIELIGKGEEQIAVLKDEADKKEIKQASMRMASLQAELATKLAIINLTLQEDIYDPGTGAAVGKTGQDSGDEAMRNTLLKEFNKETEEARKQIGELQKAIDEATKDMKSTDDQLFVYEQGLAVSRIKNWGMLADAQVAQHKDAIEKMQAEGQIGIDQELLSLRTLATERYNIHLKSLQDELAILQQDPSRNVQKIEALQTQIEVLWFNYEKDLTDIHAQGVSQRKQQTAEEVKTLTEAIRFIGEQTKNQGSVALGGIISSMQPNGVPQVAGTLQAFMDSQVERFAAATKDAATQGKFLDHAMQDLLTPMQKFHIVQEEIAPLMERYKAYPDYVKALNNQLLQANPEFQKLRDASAEFGRDLSNELDQLVVHGKSFHDVLVSLAQDLEELILKMTVLKPLEDFFGGTGNSTGAGFPGFLAHLFGAGGGGGGGGTAGTSFDFDPSIIGFADGGSPPVGQVSLVGEEGPELFVPTTSGTIIPHGAFGGGGGSIVNYNIDARGADAGVEQRIIRAIQASSAQSVQAAVAANIERGKRR